MHAAGLTGVSLRKGMRTTIRRPEASAAPGLVRRDFTANAPDRLWVADITYIATWAGFLFLAVVGDAFSRRVVGWSMANDLKTQLVLDALGMALEQRRPDGVVHHSEQGSQYTSVAFGQRCRQAGVRPSMGSAGDSTTPGAKASSRPSNANSSTGADSAPRPRPAWPYSSTSRAGTIRIVDTPVSAISPLSTTRRGSKTHGKSQALTCPRNRGNSI